MRWRSVVKCYIHLKEIAIHPPLQVRAVSDLTTISMIRSDHGAVLESYYAVPIAFFLCSIKAWTIGLSMISMARPILPPGTTMVFGRDIHEP